MKTTEQKARDIVRKNGGVARTRDFMEEGIHPRDLYRMRDEGHLERLSRGLYQLPGESPDNPDMAIIAKKAPGGVICLISALSIHEITTEIPHAVDIALLRGAEKPRIEQLPIRYYWMSGASFSEGIDTMEIGRMQMPVYCVEKTLADCFKYRNRIGMDVVLEALKLYRERCRFDGNRIVHYAKICRVAKIMQPYLEASL